MKWRNSLIYLIVLLVLFGYYYYFEILRKDQRDEAQRQAKRIFHAKIDDIQSLEIDSKDKHSVHLVKKNDWQITSPTNCDADKATLEGFLNTLVTLEVERRIVDKPENLKPFGLIDPALKITFQDGKKSRELFVGSQNPTGDSYYAKTNESEDVFLLPQGVWGILNKGLDDLRRRELFNFTPSEVLGIEIDWADGKKVFVDRSQSQTEWAAPKDPQVKIKGSKVANLLDQLHWLRADRFLKNEIENLADYGLAPPRVKVKLQLDKGRSVDMLLGKTIEQKKEISAVSSQLPAVVAVRADFLKDLPSTVEDLQERSIIALKKEEVTSIKWDLGGEQGKVVRMEENKWGWPQQAELPIELKDAWRVSSLLYDLAEAEYIKKLSPMPNIPAKPYGRLEFYADSQKLASIVWSQPTKEDSKSAIIWTEQGDQPSLAVEADSELVVRIEQDLQQLFLSRPDANSQK